MTRRTTRAYILATTVALLMGTGAREAVAQADGATPSAATPGREPSAPVPLPDARQRLRDARRNLAAAQRQVRDAARQAREDTVRRRRDATRQRQAEARRRREARRQGPGVSDTITRTARLGRNGTLDLRNASGDIAITGGRELKIEAVKRVWHPDDAAARAFLAELDVEVAERGDTIEVRTRYPGRRSSNRDRNISSVVDYTVTVPAGTSVVVSAVSGSVRVTNTGGAVRVETVGGDVHVSGSGGSRSAKTVSGTIDIEGGEGDTLTASTVSGSIVARALKVRELDVRTVNGDIRLTDVDSSRARAEALSGDIDYAGRLATNGRYDLRSHSGRVQVAPADGAGFDVDAVTFSGALRSDYGLVLTNTRGNRRVSGTFGRGGALLSLRSFSGDVAIVRKEK